MNPLTNKTILRKFFTLFPFVAVALLLMPSYKKDNRSSPDVTNVTILAGDIFAGFANLQGTDARLSYPTNVATDASGAIYIAEADNNCIRKIK